MDASVDANESGATGSPTPQRRRARSFKPRRRSLSTSRRELFDRLLPVWGIADSGPELDFAATFGREHPDVVLDIGTGDGEATIELARARPAEAVVAVDVHTPGIAALLAAIEHHDIDRVRVVHGDALDLLVRIPHGSLAGVRIFFPDPWPKNRQQHRRLVRPDVVDDLVERLRPGGQLHLATDVTSYADHMRRVADGFPLIRGGVVDRPDWRPVTRFERAALLEGRQPIDLVYRRVDTG